MKRLGCGGRDGEARDEGTRNEARRSERRAGGERSRGRGGREEVVGGASGPAWRLLVGWLVAQAHVRLCRLLGGSLVCWLGSEMLVRS